MRIEELFVVELQDRQIDSGSDRLDVRGNFVAGLVCLNLDFTGVEDDVCIRQDALAGNYHSTAGDVGRRLLQGLAGSGARTVENTLTTVFSTDFEGVIACELWAAAVISGEGDGGGETGSAKAIGGNARQRSRRKRIVMGSDINASGFEFISNKFMNGRSLFPDALRDR